MTTSPGDNHIIISADTHAGADLRGYKPYLAKKWHDEFDAWADAYSSPWDDLVDDTADRNWDSDLRMAQTTADGVVGEVIFPNTIPPFFPSISNIIPLPQTDDEYARRWAGIQAHNRWLVDFCSQAPDQRRGLIQVFPHKVEDAVAEVRWAAESDVIGGVLVPAAPPNHALYEPLFTDTFHPLWEAIEESGLAFGTHTGSGEPEYPDHPASSAVMMFEFSLFTNRTLSHLIIGGIFEKFPEIRFTMTEQGVKWVAETLSRLDGTFTAVADRPWLEMFVREAYKDLSLTPTEYFQRNCFVGASVLRPGEVATATNLGTSNIMWGSDFPHRESTYPYSIESLRIALADLDDKQKREVLSETAAKVYGFDLDALRPLADKYGPSPELLDTPLTEAELPTDNEWFLPEMLNLAR